MFAQSNDCKIKAPPPARRTWLGLLRFLSTLRNAPAMRFAQDLKHFNDPSAIRLHFAMMRARPLVAKRPGPRPPINPRATRARLRRLAGLDRRSSARQGLAK